MYGGADGGAGMPGGMPGGGFGGAGFPGGAGASRDDSGPTVEEVD